MSHVSGAFVTGTDTAVGKTIVAASLLAALRLRSGSRVAAVKPVVTGLDEPDPAQPPDHVLLAAAAGTSPGEVTSLTFGPAASPHLAAELAGVSVEPAALVGRSRASAAGAEIVVAEGAGGVLAPITPGYLMRDLALDLGLPVLVAARPGLGTINHTLLTLEACRSAGLELLGVVLTPWPAEPSPVEHSNRATIAALGCIEVAGLPPTGTSIPELAAAGAALPLTRWFGAPEAA